ncbi:MAG: hypothetical protein ACXAB7_12120 [Candidatus Kariarchaeaceae archaeon]|jgi:hypothetical protein
MQYKKYFFILLVLSLVNTSSASIHLPPAMRKSPQDLTYELGSTENTLIWAFEAHESADSPTTYSVTIDDNPVTAHTAASWQDNVDIVVNVDGLALGAHIVKITVNDSGVDSNDAVAAVDTAKVTVVEEITSSSQNTPPSSETDDAEFPYLFGLLALLIAPVVLRKRTS